jgi:putative copper resistance protein D
MPEWVGIGIRFAQFASLMLLVGIAAFPLYALQRNERADAAVNPASGALLAALAVIALYTTVGGFVVMSANMMGVSLAEIDGTMLLSIATETHAGRAALWRLAALAATLLVLAWRNDRTAFRLCAAAVLGAVSLSTLVWTGHAAATEGLAGTAHRVADTIHMLAAAIWLGAILCFLWLLRLSDGAAISGRSVIAARALAQFARVGSVCVALIVATGIINSQMIVGWNRIGESLAGPYGQLLFAKLAAFAAMLALAAFNRWRLTPALANAVQTSDANTALAAMRRSVFTEAAAAAAIVAIVAWLGTLDPLA